MWGDKRYHSWNYHLRKTFGTKVFKLPLDAGFTCPNRDGTYSTEGCIYCSSRGSGDFAGNVNYSLEKQYLQTREMMHKKWPDAKYIAYFQAFTNTYASESILRELYNTALSFPNVVGISIATRPDCLPAEVLDLLEELNNKTYLWVELGLQTVHDKTASLINRGHDYRCFIDGLNKLQERNINTCAHVIYGLPGETISDMWSTSKTIATLPLQGIKFHLLHVLKGTPLAKIYQQGGLEFMDFDAYIKLVVDTLEILPDDMIIHRLTGDGPRDLLLGPMWSQKKWEILNAIDHELLNRSSKQGAKRHDFLLHNRIINNTICYKG
ncbi:TIGR01212 family radical SAM protein [Desulfuribacillus alkaliarsenatis]|uniref:TIGR01212 family radical SAM protein n=1 Tax=Desulfuribacillus alkaliarsenatis TaxID=766136 RepID=A0A1E5G162_9FIRM|nr:TIGR01212 family radical SAM protein [Desulfuribacillus alkaliarsenatis]OEF96188.1 TIGR01212 family radical SAM protein [Desulfuribacillus alkaliarsenatis]